MTILIRIFCGACGGNAGVGLTPDHANFNVKAAGGRIINGNVVVCHSCARATV